jgi:pimeloyl-ACP methyl ester carboxylesterase
MSVRVSEWPVVVDSAALAELRARLANVRLPALDDRDWSRGTPTPWLATLLEEWHGFDDAAYAACLGRAEHFRADIEGQAVHVARVESRHPTAIPILMTHGWPGSFLEHQKITPLLTEPSDGDGPDSTVFTVVTPSLPGFGFSGPPKRGLTARQTARIWHLLMTEGFGYERYAAHGSDLGAGVTAWLARDYPDEVMAIHLATPGMAVPAGPRSDAEQRFDDEVSRWTAAEGAYAHEHATKPATLAVGLSDSPAGLAAWIGEKVVAWSSDLLDGETSFDRELLLATLTLYWTTNTVGSSLLPYWAFRQAGEPLPADDPADVPTGITVFGGERVPFPKPPRELARRFYRVVHWEEYPTGGHFPAMAAPELLASALRRCFGTIGDH